MLFLFLLDVDECMSDTHFGNLDGSKKPSLFLPSALDAAAYFIDYYIKLVNGILARRPMDESCQQKLRANEHRCVLMTFSTEQDGGSLELRSTWKDRYVALGEELKNVTFSGRQKRRSTARDSSECSTVAALKKISSELEAFLEKFSNSYFTCFNRTDGYFMWNESESVLVFVLSSCGSKLKLVQSSLTNGWQRKNVFIRVHPESHQARSCDNQDSPSSSSYLPMDSGWNYFPVTTMRDVNQLAATLQRANLFDSLEVGGMEMLGKGGWVDLNFPITDEAPCLGLLRHQSIGNPKWPIPCTLTSSHWNWPRPIFHLQALPALLDLSSSSFGLEFDEYLLFVPISASKYTANSQPQQPQQPQAFLLLVESKSGKVPIGQCELISANRATTASISNSLFRVWIGPFNFVTIPSILQGKTPLSAYLQHSPKFYERFLRGAWGEARWNQALGGIKPWPSEFPLPEEFLEGRDMLRDSHRRCQKRDLASVAEQSEDNFRQRLDKRQMEHFYLKAFPSLDGLQRDSEHLARLCGRFKLALMTFGSSCDESFGESQAGHQYRLPNVIFKHCQTIQRMTDFSEMMRKRKPLRPLFNENEHDLFLILKELPALREEMSAVHFVSGDIFGNPFKKDRKMVKRKPRKHTFDQESAQEEHESEDAATIDETSGSNDRADITALPFSVSNTPTSSSVDEIDYQSMEDIGTEIVIDGSIVNLPVPEFTGCPVDMVSVRRYIQSPGGLRARRILEESLSGISDPEDLDALLNLCARYKRHSLALLINRRLAQIKM